MWTATRAPAARGGDGPRRRRGRVAAPSPVVVALMTGVAVVAHRSKTLGGGLPELRRLLAAEGVDPMWYEVDKSRKARRAACDAVADGADLVFALGRRRHRPALPSTPLAGTGADLAILPAGTANLLASNLGVPIDLVEAVQTGLHRRPASHRPGPRQRRALRRDGWSRLRRLHDQGRQSGHEGPRRPPGLLLVRCQKRPQAPAAGRPASRSTAARGSTATHS